MSVNLVILKSGEELIADVKEIKSGKDVVGYFFNDPLTLHCEANEEPEVLLEEETESKYNSKVSIADWVETIVKPQEQLIKLYEEKINGRNESDQSPIID